MQLWELSALLVFQNLLQKVHEKPGKARCLASTCRLMSVVYREVWPQTRHSQTVPVSVWDFLIIADIWASNSSTELAVTKISKSWLPSKRHNFGQDNNFYWLLQSDNTVVIPQRVPRFIKFATVATVKPWKRQMSGLNVPLDVDSLRRSFATRDTLPYKAIELIGDFSHHLGYLIIQFFYRTRDN